MRGWSDALVKLFIFVVLFYTVTAVLREYAVYILLGLGAVAGVWVIKKIRRFTRPEDDDFIRRLR